ncbi:MAG: four helix bundle protein [Planctomycetota bacterium]
MSEACDGRPPGDLKQRTKSFAVRIVRLYAALPKETAAQVIGKQLLRSGTSVGAHYRESQRSRSSAEFVSKAEVALQELEESDYWIDLLVECEIVPAKRLAELKQEINELLAMLTATVKTIKGKKR